MCVEPLSARKAQLKVCELMMSHGVQAVFKQYKQAALLVQMCDKDDAEIEDRKAVLFELQQLIANKYKKQLEGCM